MNSQPMLMGIADNWRVLRRPIVSRIGPDNSEPIGVARLWTEAAEQIIHCINNWIGPYCNKEINPIFLPWEKKSTKSTIIFKQIYSRINEIRFALKLEQIVSMQLFDRNNWIN